MIISVFMKVRLLIVNYLLPSPMLVRESNRKLWNQQCFTLTFPKPPQPGRKKRSRPSELQITAPVSTEKGILKLNLR